MLDGTGGIKILIPEEIPAEQTSAGNIVITNSAGHDSIVKDQDTMNLIISILNLVNLEFDNPTLARPL